jgi:hypothetical protein
MNGTDLNPTTEPAKPLGFCRSCGKPLEADELRVVEGVIYCAEHVPAPKPSPAPAAPWTAPPPSPPSAAGASPALAFLLGFIPGVGAIYNGQYAKGLVHVIIFGVLVSIASSGAGGLEPLFGMLIAAWFFYMAFEAYHTAKRRQLGQPVDEFSSLFPAPEGAGSTLTGAALIAFGVLFLLINFDVIRLHQVVRFWPVVLIVLGAYMLYSRLGGGRRPPLSDWEAKL